MTIPQKPELPLVSERRGRDPGRRLSIFPRLGNLLEADIVYTGKTTRGVGG
jgi:hypothetical protein